jgi:FSR family fosmidomycin resistance protein-like MFS transporter
MKENKGQKSFQAAEILVLSLAHFVHDVYSSFLAPLLPLLIEKLSMSLTQAGFLSAVMQLPALLNPFIGQLADRASLRYFVILAPLMTAVPMSLIGLAPSYGVLLLLLFMAGISVAMFHVPAPVMIARMAGSRKGRGMSFFMTGGELARTVGPLTAVGAVALLGLEGFWPVMVVGIAASCLLYWRFRRVDLSFHNKKQKTSLKTTFRNMRHVLLPLTVIVLARSFMHGSLTAFLPTFIQSQTGNIWQGGLALTLFEAAGVAGVLLAGSFSDHLGRRRMLFISLVGAPLSVLLFVYSSDWLRFLALLSCGFMLLSTTPVMLALVQEHAGDSPAAANGMFMMISFLARSSVVVLIGLIADHTGLETAYLISAAAGCAGIPFILLLPGRAAQIS